MIEKGSRFALREGGRTIASGVVSKLLTAPAEADKKAAASSAAASAKGAAAAPPAGAKPAAAAKGAKK